MQKFPRNCFSGNMYDSDYCLQFIYGKFVCPVNSGPAIQALILTWTSDYEILGRKVLILITGRKQPISDNPACHPAFSIRVTWQPATWVTWKPGRWVTWQPGRLGHVTTGKVGHVTTEKVGHVMPGVPVTCLVVLHGFSSHNGAFSEQTFPRTVWSRFITSDQLFGRSIWDATNTFLAVTLQSVSKVTLTFIQPQLIQPNEI